MPVAGLFTRPTWGRVPVLVEGTLLALHRRTVSAALRAAGRDRTAACCTDLECRRTRPSPVRGQAMRTEIGRPSSSMRLSA